MAVPDATTYLVTIRHLDFAVEQWGPVLAFNFGQPVRHLVHEVVQNLQARGTAMGQCSRWIIRRPKTLVWSSSNGSVDGRLWNAKVMKREEGV